MLGNILEQEDIIKGLPDDYLYAEAEQPSGQLPPFLVVSEIQRRTDMRERYEATQDQPQGTVTQQIVAEGLVGMSPMDMASQTMGSPIPADPTSQVPVVAATGAPPPPTGGVAIGASGLAGRGGQPQMVASGGVVGMSNGGTAGGGSNMVAAVNAAIDKLRAEGRDPSVYSQYDLRIMGEKILGTDRPPSLVDEGYRQYQPEDGYNLDTVSRYRTSPFATPAIIGDVYDTAGAAKDWAVDTAGDVAEYVREDEQAGTLRGLARGVGDVVSEGFGVARDASADWLMDTFGIEDRMAAGMFGKPDETEEGSMDVDDTLDVDVGNIADIADQLRREAQFIGSPTEDEILSVGVEDQQAIKTDQERATRDVDAQEYLDKMETLTAENVAAEESIVSDYRDRIERSQQQARDDAFNAWLGHFGAGVAGGDLQGGLERGTGAIGDIKKESRATTLALEEGIVSSERSRRKAAVDALKSMADIDVNFLKLANEVSREEGLMDRSEDDRQIALMNLIGDLMPDTTISEPHEIRANLTTMFNAVSHLFGLPQVSTTGGSGEVGTDPTTRVPITDFNQ